jgi:hypothetical protein
MNRDEVLSLISEISTKMTLGNKGNWLQYLEELQWVYGVTYNIDRSIIDDFYASGNIKYIHRELVRKRLELC